MSTTKKSVTKVDRAKEVVTKGLSALNKKQLKNVAYHLLVGTKITGTNYYDRGAYCPASLAWGRDLKPTGVTMRFRARKIYDKFCNITDNLYNDLGFQGALDTLSKSQLRECLVKVVREKLKLC